jgi:hypothetical protein
MVKKTLSKSDFLREWESWTERKDTFSYEGKCALFDYLESIEEESNPIELDIIGLCCEYAEYENLAEFQKDYNAEEYPTIEAIRDKTQVIEIPESNGFIIQQF